MPDRCIEKCFWGKEMSDATRNKGITDALELLDIVHSEAKKRGIIYTLSFECLYNYIKEDSCVDLFKGIQLLFSYNSFIAICDALRAYKGEYYCIDFFNDSTFEACYLRFYKKSGIVLGDERSKDERFYDNFIEIIPYYCVDSNYLRARFLESKIIRGMKSACGRAIVPGTVKIRNLLAKMSQFHYYKKGKSFSVDGVIRFLERTHKSDNMYIFIPYLFKHMGRFCVKKSTYEFVDTIMYIGHETYCLKETEAVKWLNSAYSKEEERQLKKSNIVIKEGASKLKKVQEISLEILVEFDRVCRKHGIKYIISAGTLLGAARHKGFIPWDDDIDLYILYSEWEKFIKVEDEEIDKEKFFVRTQETDVDNNLCLFQIKRNNTVYCKTGRNKYDTHLGVFIDIHPFFNGSNNIVGHSIQNRMAKMYKTMTWAHMGAESESNLWKRKWYLYIKRHITNKDAYAKFMKWATKYQNKETNNICFLYVKRNPFKKGMNQKRYFEDVIDIEFEGHKFMAPRDYEELLDYCYSKDWRKYPNVKAQINHHFPGLIDLDNVD